MGGGTGEVGEKRSAPGAIVKSNATNGNNYRGMIFHALIPITDLPSKKNIEGEIPFPFKPTAPHRSQMVVEKQPRLERLEHTLFWLIR